MNRKVGHLIRASLCALPLMLPGVALAQSAGAGSSAQPSGTAGTTAAGSDSTTQLTYSHTGKLEILLKPLPKP